MPQTAPDIHAEHLRSLSNGDDALGEMLTQALARAIAKDPRTKAFLDDGSRRTEVDSGAAAEMSHVRDWLAVDLAENAHWISRTNQDGVPMKLAKISSLRQASNEADKAMRRRLSRGFGKEHAEAGEGTSILAVLEDGWSIVRLETPQALDAESHEMQHCIGHGYYDRQLADGTGEFLSLRDPHGSPHATIHVRPEARLVVEVSGKQNETPEERYLRLIRPFLKEGFVMDKTTMIQLGFVRDVNGAYHDVGDLPEVFETHHDLDLSECRGPIPKRIVCGSIILPKNVPGGVLTTEIVAARNIKAVGGNLRRFAHPPRAGGGLSLADLPDFDEIHPEISVRTKIALVELPSLRALPRNLTFWGILTIRRTGIGLLPAGMRDLHTLELRECPFHEIPEELVVRGETTIDRCPVSVLPGKARFEGDVSISCQTLRRVEANAFGGSLEISFPGRRTTSRAATASAPEPFVVERGVAVEGSLKIQNADMPKGLPAGLRVGGDLEITGGELGLGGPDIQIVGQAYFRAAIQPALPDGLTVGGDLLVRGGGFASLGADTTVGKNLAIDGDAMTSLPENLRIAGRISMSMSNVCEIGTGFELGELSYETFSDIARFPEGMRIGRIGRIGWAGGFRGRLPAGLRVDGDLDLSDFEPDEIPEGLEVGGTLKLPEGNPSPGF